MGGQGVLLSMDGSAVYNSFTVWAGIQSPAAYVTASTRYEVMGSMLALDNNGQVISTSAYSVRDYSSYDEIHNTIDNPRDGVNGWFARNGGRVILPKIAVAAGTKTYNWGEEANDATPDLINSVRFALHDQQAEGFVKIDLLATDNAAVPLLPAGHHFVGLWSFDDTGVAAGGIDLTVRYDSTRMLAEHLEETQAKLWYYDGQWQRVWDVQKDLGNNLISGHMPDGSFFAVSTPEPAGVLATLAVGAAILLRRRSGNS